MKIISRLTFVPLILFTILCTFTFNNRVKALYNPTSYYDAISWIYTYDATYTPSYNCLGWATGSMTWEWPSLWGSAATKSQVDAYLISKGYYSVSSTSTVKKIIAYGSSTSSIVHFAKVNSGAVSAKWGQLERFTHGISINPYISTGVYGSSRAYYAK